MADKKGGTAATIGALLIVVAIVGLVGAVAWGVFHGGSDLSKALLTPAIALVVSVITLGVSKSYEVNAAIKKDLRDRKVPVYEEIVKGLYRMLLSEKVAGGKMSEQEQIAFFAKTTEQLTIWGSDEVVIAWGNVRTHSLAERLEPFIHVFEDLLLALRKDLGHKNENMGRGAILRLFINDLDEKGEADAPDTTEGL